MISKKSDFWKYKFTIPNFLTLLRPVSGFIFVFFLFLNYPRIVLFGIFLFGVLTDFFDGFFAKRFNQCSEFGKFFDPIADRIFFITVFISIIIYVIIQKNSGLFSYFSRNILLIIFLLIPREILCSIGILISLLRKKKPYVWHVFFAKITVVLQYIAICFIILDSKFLMTITIFSFIIGFIHGVFYIKGALK